MIRKLCSAAFMCFAALFVTAQQPVTVGGVLNFSKFHIQSVKLYKVSDGRCRQIAETMPTPDGKFGFYFYPSYEGLYVIGIANEASPISNHKFYLKAGDKLSVTLTDWDYQLTGNDNSEENKELYQWHQFTDEIYQKSINFMTQNSTYVDFFPQMEDIAAKAKTWLSGKHTNNAKFDAAMPDIMRMDMAMYATNFLQTPRTAHPSKDEYSPFFNALNTEDYTRSTRLIYNYPWGLRTMQSMAMLDYRKSGKSFAAGFNMLKEFSGFIANDTLKGDLALQSVEGTKDYNKYKTVMDEYGKYILTDSQKVAQVNIAAPLQNLKKGDAAYNFSYEDNHGVTKTLAGMKGKVVLVDVWATWCGPCKAQIPYLKQLEEDMKGKDVQFVSISVDEPNDKKKWLNFIDTAHLGGTQLFAGGWSQNGGIAQFYKIKGIPRFMVFDKNGKIESTDSPRPSDPELKQLLEKMLAE